MIQMQSIFEQTYVADTVPLMIKDIIRAFDTADIGNGRGQYVVTIVRRFDDFVTGPPKEPLLRA